MEENKFREETLIKFKGVSHEISDALKLVSNAIDILLDIVDPSVTDPLVYIKDNLENSLYEIESFIKEEEISWWKDQ